ncbi:putative PGG domain-containing protein [Helianthus debilis subsp. tardiflorus]
MGVIYALKFGNSRLMLGFYQLFSVPHIKRLQEDKMKHDTALMILKFICNEVCKLETDHFEHCYEAFIMALKNNTTEVIQQIITTFPHSIWYKTVNGYILPQVSIMNRCENVYNFFVHEVTHNKCFHIMRVDEDENNLLHLAGRLAPTHKLNMVSGAALQMQRELQWFEEVRKLMRPREREAMNKKEETPWMVFRKEHKDLRKEGEEWIKKTSDSYTITAALIITIVFAAAITVPGGNNGDTGKPIFGTKPSFLIFIFSDAISLFTSTTALLLFLSILTTRYEENDFLYKLPRRLILGLVMLFMSVTTMLISFSAALYIMIGKDNSWVLIIIATITCLPIASFVTLQLPLLVELICSTYGSGIFRKPSDLRITP